MSAEESKAVVRRYFGEVWNQGKIEVADEILAPNWVRRGVTGVTHEGVDAFKQFRSTAGSRYGTINITINEQIAEGDRAVAHITLETGQGAEKQKWDELHIFRVTNGKIVDNFVVSLRA